MKKEGTFENLLTTKFRWPTHGDQPFAQSSDWEKNAYIDRHGHGRAVLMTSGYKQIADLAVSKAREDRYQLDLLVYPIIFNYRQFIELSLKYLIATYGRAASIAPKWKTHDLKELWETFKKLLEWYGDQDSPEIRIVEEIIGEFSKVDPGSFSFRYPVDTKGKLIELPHQELNLSNLADVMQGLDGYFTGCDGWLDALRNATP